MEDEHFNKFIAIIAWSLMVMSNLTSTTEHNDLPLARLWSCFLPIKFWMFFVSYCVFFWLSILRLQFLRAFYVVVRLSVSACDAAMSKLCYCPCTSLDMCMWQETQRLVAQHRNSSLQLLRCLLKDPSVKCVFNVENNLTWSVEGTSIVTTNQRV